MSPVVHGIVAEQVQMPAVAMFVGRCLCGWSSETVASLQAALGAGREHVSEVEASGVTARQVVCVCGWQSEPTTTLAEELAGMHAKIDDGNEHAVELVDVDLPVMTAAKRLAIWQTEPCPTWCVAVHEDRDLLGDRRHDGQDLTVDLHEHRAWNAGTGQAPEWFLPELRAALVQPVREATPSVYLWADDIASPFSLTLTLAEAQELVTGLQAMLHDASHQVTR